MPELKEITTKTGYIIKESWCRKCVKMKPAPEFYECTDLGMVDSVGLMSVCKTCIQKLYVDIFAETQSLEKTLHRLCIMLNVKFSNEAADATKRHVQTLQDNGKGINTIFGVYRQKLVATNKSMNKSIVQYEGYEDVGTIFTEKQVEIKEVPIPKDVLDFWGHDTPRADIEYLEREYANFKQTHSADSYAEIVLLKQVCYTMLLIKKLRIAGDDTGDLVKELQALMKNLAISPNASKANASNSPDTFGLWIQDIEREEPAQWLSKDSRGDMFRDVGDVEGYFQKYIVRPLKNFITQSRDFNVDESDDDSDSGLEFIDINDGETD